VGVALSATLLETRQEVRLLHYADRQILYPLGTEQATETIQGVLMQDGQMGGTLDQMTTLVLRQQLGERAAMASYHDLFAMFAMLAAVCLIPALLLQTGRRARSDQADQQPTATSEELSETSERR
jgi:hypothetical protein